MDENTPSSNECMKISQKGVERKDLRLKRNVPGSPSGPAEFTFLNLSKLDSISEILKKQIIGRS